MKRYLSVAFLSALCAWAQPAQGQQIADGVCPTAVPAIRAMAALKDTSDPVKAADVVAPVVAAYKACAQLALSDGAIEPAAHYDEIRAAQYLVVLGRQLLKQQKYDEAHSVFADARKLSGDIADWLPSSRNNTGMSHSQYRDSAIEVAKAADIELAKLVPTATPTP